VVKPAARRIWRRGGRRREGWSGEGSIAIIAVEFISSQVGWSDVEVRYAIKGRMSIIDA